MSHVRTPLKGLVLVMYCEKIVSTGSKRRLKSLQHCLSLLWFQSSVSAKVNGHASKSQYLVIDQLHTDHEAFTSDVTYYLKIVAQLSQPLQ